MSLYPSLEDMKVDHMAKVQQQVSQDVLHAAAQAQGYVLPPPTTSPTAPTAALPYPIHPDPSMQQDGSHSSAYPSLGEYMGLEFTTDVLALNMPEYLPQEQQLQQVGPTAVAPYGMSSSQVVAPVTGSAMALIAHTSPTNAIRQVVLCKGEDGRAGLRVKDINKGIFVCLVMKDSPAALAGLRFGDQVLELNGVAVAGFSTDKVHAMVKASAPNGITMAIRDRPFERSITLHKNSSGHIGFQLKDGEVMTIVKDSSAARNGMLTQHHMLEVNGQNVVGLKDKQITAIINDCGSVVTFTIMPSFLYNHIMKHMATSLTKIMDHALPVM